MAIYYINASGSDTYPFDTVVKGAITFGSLLSSITLNSGDIVEVVDNGLIDDSATGAIDVGVGTTIRSYSGNINKPTIKLNVSTGLIQGYSTFKNLKIYKDRNDGDLGISSFIIYSRVDNSSIAKGNHSVEGCVIYIANTQNDGISVGIFSSVESTGDVEIVPTVTLQNNLIYGMQSGIHSQFDNGGESSYTAGASLIANNTISCDNGYGLWLENFDDSSGADVEILNNIFVMDNSVSSQGILCENTTGVIQDYNNLYNCYTEYTGVVRGSHNIDSVSGGNNPKFVTPGTDFSLQESSPCIDTGIDNGTYSCVPTVDILGIFRPQRSAYDIGAYESHSFSVSYFNQSTVADNASVISNIRDDLLISTIQAHYADTYFDAIEKISKVVVYYVHEDIRQVVKVYYEGSPLTSTTSWSNYARDGSWKKTLVVVYDHDGATHELPRSAIGASEDIIHNSGFMVLNTI